MKRWQILLIGGLVSAVMLVLAFRQADFNRIVQIYTEARYIYIVLMGVLFVGLIAIRAWRWQILTEGDLSYGDAFWLFNIGYLFNNVLPARLGEVVRAVLAGRRMPFGKATSTIVVERLFDIVAIVLQLGFVLLLLDLPDFAKGAGALLGVGAVVGIGLLAYTARRPEWALRIGVGLMVITPLFDEETAREFLEPFIEGLAGVARPRIFAAGMGLSILSWALSGLASWVLMLAFWDSMPVVMGQLAVAAAGLGIAVPAAPSGAGPFHAAVIGVLSAVGYDADIARSYAIALHANNFIVPTILGVIGLLREGITFGEAVREAESVQTS